MIASVPESLLVTFLTCIMRMHCMNLNSLMLMLSNKLLLDTLSTA